MPETRVRRVVAQRLGWLPVAPERSVFGTQPSTFVHARCAEQRADDVLQWNGWCQSVQRSADADEQLKHTSGARYHLQ